MTTPDYPSTIPYKPQRDAFSEEPYQPLSSAEMEDGPDIDRVQSNTRIQKLAYRLIFTDAEYATWETFVLTTIKRAGHFMMSVPASGSTYSTRRVKLDKGMFKRDPLEGYWVVTFTLCVFPAA